MTDAPELLPCPFCGSQEARVLPCNSNMVREHRIYPIVRCCGCYLDLPGKNDDFSDDGKTAVSAWNTRATNQQALDAAREEGRRAGLEEAAILLADHIDRDMNAANRMIEAYTKVTMDTPVRHWLSQCLRALAQKEGK